MKEIFTFYRAVDPMKGSWDGYGHFNTGQDDFLAFVTDAPSGASIHTPELIKEFWRNYSESNVPLHFPAVELADALNRLQNNLQQKGRQENVLYQATIAVARKTGSKLFYCCIGDSVLQIYSGEKLYRLSDSEIWDGALITGSGQRTAERKKTRDLRFLGSHGDFIQAGEVCSLDLHDQDLLLFYTDGVEDLLPPDQLLGMLTSDSEEMRRQMEVIFAQDKVKDDATLLAIPAKVPAAFQAEKEIASLRLQLEKLQKEQSSMRSQILDFAATRSRIEKMETSLTQVAQDVQRIAKRSSGERSRIVPAGSGVSARRNQRFVWLIPLLSLLLGTVVGAFLFSGKGKGQAPPKVTQQRANVKRVVAPPEIPSATDCTYTIQKGDSLDKIATAKNVTVDQLLSWNPAQKKGSPLLIGKALIVCKELP